MKPTRRLLITLSVLLVATCGFMFIANGSAHSKITTTSEVLPDGHVRFQIENRSRVPITALAVVGIRTPIKPGRHETSVRYFDSVLDPLFEKDLMPGQTYSFTLFGPNPPPDTMRREVTLKAALFADGTIWGDAEWTQRLLLRRSSAEGYINNGLQLLTAARTSGSTREAAIKEAEDALKVNYDSASTVEEKQMVQQVYREMILFLQGSTRNDGAAISQEDSMTAAANHLMARAHRLTSAKKSVMSQSGSN